MLCYDIEMRREEKGLKGKDISNYIFFFKFSFFCDLLGEKEKKMLFEN